MGVSGSVVCMARVSIRTGGLASGQVPRRVPSRRGRLPSRRRDAVADRLQRAVLRGRRNECEALDRQLQRVRAGQSSVQVLRGEAGVGKTALLEYVAEQASECRIARVAGVESEMELAFAGLHQLCAPMLDGLEALPGPQQDALRVAFGMQDGAAPDRFLVALAILSLLAGAAEARAARVSGRRCAMARSGLRADAGVRGAAPAGGADRHGVRRPRAQPTSTS